MSTLLEQNRERKIRRWIVNALTAVIVIFSTVGILYGLKPLIFPFIMGAFLAYLFKPLAKSFQIPHWSKYVRLVAFFAGVVVVISSLTQVLSEALPNDEEKAVLKVRLQYRLNERYKSWMGLQGGKKGNFLYENVGQDLEPLMQQTNYHLKLSDKEKRLFQKHQEDLGANHPEAQKYSKYYIENLKSQNEEPVAPQDTPTITTGENGAVIAAPAKKKPSGVLAGFMKAASEWIIFPLVFIFLLLDKGEILHFFMRLVPNRYFELAYSVVENVDEALGKYIRGTLIECALVGISLTIGFYMCGIDFPVACLIGIVGGLTNAIPFLGTAIACILSALYSLVIENVQSMIPFVNDNNLMIAVVSVVMIVHLLDNAIFQPLVVGKAVNLHPLIVVLGVFGGSMMFGFAGLILAIPTIVIVTVVMKTLFLGLQQYKII